MRFKKLVIFFAGAAVVAHGLLNVCRRQARASAGAFLKTGRNSMRKTLVTAMVALAVLGAGPAAAETVIKFSHVVAPDTPKGKAALKFKELAESYTGGNVKVEIYPNSQLYKDKEEVEALQLGAVQMLAPSLSKFGPLGAKEFEVFDTPFLFPDKEGLQKITNGEIGKSLLAKLEDKGIKGLAFWDNGFKILSSNRPLKLPDDLLGVKMRIQSSKVIEAQMMAWGGVPQVMAFSEVYQALQTGVVDGTENPPSNMYTQKMHEVQKYAALTNHGYLGYAVIVNKKFWDELPEDVRANLEKAMAEATVYANEIAQAENDNALAAMKAAGKTEFYELTAEDRKAWVEASKPVYEEVAARVGQETLDAVMKESGAASN
jgi:C4-dicarboxylate-binding protein DctP